MHVRPMPKVSLTIFMALTTKKVTEKAQKWAKMARFWPKMRYNGRVMAREMFFHQCLWVTKFCAKFGRSRIPRTARMHNSLIVLRCMWKEPAPFREFRRVGEPTRIFQFEKNQKGLKLWVVSRERATEVFLQKKSLMFFVNLFFHVFHVNLFFYFLTFLF